MGMFDSLYSSPPGCWAYEHEWQTKAYSCSLDTWHVGDELPDIDGYAHIQTYQVEVLGGNDVGGRARDSFATVSCGVLAAVPADRDPSLPLFNYSGHLIDDGERTREQQVEAAEDRADQVAFDAMRERA